MPDTISPFKAIPAAYPIAGHDGVWQRIEGYVVHRWTPRSLVWFVDGPGHWRAVKQDERAGT